MTFGELLHACRAKTDFEWNQTSSLMALIANRHRSREEPKYTKEGFYQPQLVQPSKRVVMGTDRLNSLFGVFTKRA
jgi:hypothetical protein